MQISIPSANILADIPFWVSVDSFLDEELDSCPLSIENTNIPTPLPRFTPAVLLVEKEDPTYWMIGSDTVSTGPNGKSQHVVQLIEPTKWLERFMVGNKAVTQPLFVDYFPGRKVEGEDVEGSLSLNLLDLYWYTSPWETGTTIPIYPLACFKQADRVINASSGYLGTSISLACKVVSPSGSVQKFEKTYTKSYSEDVPNDWKSTAIDTRTKLDEPGVYTVEYTLDFSPGNNQASKNRCVYKIASVSKTAGKERSLKDAALSMIYAAESLNESESPTFYLNEALSAYLDTITAPEITVTNATLREALDEIAKYVGAITRLDILPPPQNGGDFRYEINFEKYCKDTEADTSQLGNPVGAVTRSVSCEDYCTALDATVENIVNYRDGGTIGDPSPQLFKTPRSEDASYRVTEGSAKVVTSFPIERIDGLTCRIYDENGDEYNFDLLPYLFESTEYGALSSYEPTYPYSKAYALCYTLGQKHITALDFTVPNPVHEIFETPAIVNIINREIDTKGYGLGKFGNENPINFTKLLFRVTYVPTGAIRMRMRKPNSYGKPESVLAFNQSAAKLDAKAFGRSMFGSVLRMGNEITTYQYTPPLGAKVPQKGERFGENGYISEVHVEYRVSHKTVTIEVSEGFNRLSQFVGVNKTQRIFEISERMSLDRHIVYEDFCLIGTKSREGTGSIATEKLINNITRAFVQSEKTDITPSGPFIVAQGYDESDGALTPCMLPALCYGIGNAVVFTASFEDNFGAGRRIDARKDKEVIENVTYEYYAIESDVRYTDLFGRIDTMDFIVEDSIYPTLNQSFYYSVADALPQKPGVIDGINLPSILMLASATGDKRLKIDKDSRERIKTLSYQISFLEADGVKISPYFAESTSFAGPPKFFKIVPISKPINNLTEWVEVDGDPASVIISELGEPPTISCTMPSSGKGWAAVAWDVNGPTMNGKTTKRFLFGKNGAINAGETLKIYLSFFRKNNIKEV